MDDLMTAPAALDRRLRALEDSYLLLNHDLKLHLLACDRRGARLERLAWASGGIVVSILGIVVRAYFHFGSP